MNENPVIIPGPSPDEGPSEQERLLAEYLKSTGRKGASRAWWQKATRLFGIRRQRGPQTAGKQDKKKIRRKMAKASRRRNRK